MTTLAKRLALTLAILSVVAAARAADVPRQVWLASTREAPRCGNLDDAAQAVRYWRLNDDCGWTPAETSDFRADAKATEPTVVFVHGNQTDANEAVTKGLFTYQQICSQADGKPFRYVIWSWPATRICRSHRSDAQLKVTYANAESYYFATWLHGLRPGMKVSLVGHSFGPRIIAGALHLLAGGEVAGRKMPDETVSAWTSNKRHPLRAVLLAPAGDADSLAPCGRNGLALSLLDQVLVTRNRCDDVLRWYPWLYGRGGPNAMGFTGPRCFEDATKLTVLDVSASVGKTHEYQFYCSSPDVCSQWTRYTFLDDMAANNVPQKAP